MDILPSTENEIVLKRNDIEELGKGEDEPTYPPSSKAIEEMIVKHSEVALPPSGKQKTVDYAAESFNHFSSLSPKMQVISKSFTFTCGKEEDAMMEWCILLESKQITVCPMKTRQEEGVFNEEIPWNSDPAEVDHNSALLEKFIPFLKGKAKLLDEFLWHDSKNPRWETPRKRLLEKYNIWFHHDHSDDPDELVSQIFFFFYAVLSKLH